jgi:hypothetical protein
MVIMTLSLNVVPSMVRIDRASSRAADALIVTADRNVVSASSAPNRSPKAMRTNWSSCGLN